jgi:hypothetical protein
MSCSDFLGIPRTEASASPEGCQAFQQRVRAATIRAVSFIDDFYKVDSSIRVPPINGTCTEYTSILKKEVNTFLIFCLAENSVKGLSFLDSISYSASIASVTKAWPDSCDCMSHGLEEELKSRLRHKKETPMGYLEFVRDSVRKIFPRGITMDEFERQALRVTPPYTATVEYGRSEGGSYASWQGRREDYIKFLEKPQLVHEPSFMVAKAAGKPRPLVKNHSSYLALKPLHSAIYDRISRLPWLLRGTPSQKKLVKAGFKPGSSYLSADYSAATDNLPTEVAEAIVDELSMRSSSELSPLFSEMRKSLRPTIKFSDGHFTPARGQMMGNLCSFPLLCLQNYIAARWVDRLMGCGKTPLLINGDDLVAQVSEDWLKLYRSVAPSLGLELNEKKTMYSKKCITINSMYFTSNFREVPYVKAKSLLTRDPRVVGGVMNDVLAPFLRVRSTRYGRLIRKLSLFFRGRIRASGMTLWSLGFQVRKDHEHFIIKELRKREKERSGHPWRPYRPLPHPMKPQLEELSSELLYLVEEGEVASAMVDAHWNAGEYVRPEKEKITEVKRRLRAERMTRLRGVGMKETLKRLSASPVVEEKTWIPKKLADCYSLSHDRVRLENDFLLFESCDVCERVQRAMLGKSARDFDEFNRLEGERVANEWNPKA